MLQAKSFFILFPRPDNDSTAKVAGLPNYTIQAALPNYRYERTMISDRKEEHIACVENYLKAVHLFRDYSNSAQDPHYSQVSLETWNFLCINEKYTKIS